MNPDQTLIPHLFRTEYHRIVAVLARFVGAENIGIAEDIASDTFLIAVETWGLKGLPENPVAWLHNVARNNVKTHLKRDTLFRTKIAPAIKAISSVLEEPEIDLSASGIKDSQLLMIFAICHPSLAREAQICLALRLLCGFGIEEIADSFLTNKETINKRLFRAKEKLRANRVQIELPGPGEINERLETVLTTIYLLFNEGYYSVSQHMVLRKDLCLEAVRLCNMLVENEATDTPDCNALLALMCFHVSRFEARIRPGEMVPFEDQDATLWNRELISKGEYYLDRSVGGEKMSHYHLEAMIAYWHTTSSQEDVKWRNILQLYDYLLKTAFSPTAALNRIYAFSKVHGRQQAVFEAEKLRFPHGFLYYVLMGELNMHLENGRARVFFEKALLLAKTSSDKETLKVKIGKCC